MTRLIQSAAEADILAQVEWYAEQGLPDVARRYLAAVYQAIDALAAMPLAGTSRRIDNPQLEGLRTWPVKELSQL